MEGQIFSFQPFLFKAVGTLTYCHYIWKIQTGSVENPFRH